LGTGVLPRPDQFLRQRLMLISGSNRAFSVDHPQRLLRSFADVLVQILQGKLPQGRDGFSGFGPHVPQLSDGLLPIRRVIAFELPEKCPKCVILILSNESQGILCGLLHVRVIVIGS
jgi:hypothetical protein